MPDPLSLMLDSMIFAVENGLSYDGIVSVPQMGLEDFGHRPGMAGWLDESAELFRSTTGVIARFLHGTPQTRTEPPSRGDSWSDTDFEIDSDDEHSEPGPVIHPEPPPSQTSHTGEESSYGGDEGDETRSRPSARLPRKLDRKVLGNIERELDKETRGPVIHPESPPSQTSHTGEESSHGGDEADEARPRPSPRLPRKLDREVLGTVECEVDDETRPRVTLPIKRDERAGGQLPRKTRPTFQETLPRKRDGQVPTDDQKSSSQVNVQVLGDIAGLNVGQSSSTSAGNEEDANPLSNVELRRYPRLRREPMIADSEVETIED